MDSFQINEGECSRCAGYGICLTVDDLWICPICLKVALAAGGADDRGGHVAPPEKGGDALPLPASLAEEMERVLRVELELQVDESGPRCLGLCVDLWRAWIQKARALQTALAAQTDAAQYNCVRAHDLQAERDEAVKRAEAAEAKVAELEARNARAGQEESDADEARGD